MPDSTDLRSLLQSWPFDPEKNLRLIRGADGREALQVRTPLGIEQLELEGRPDGRQPAGHDSFLDLQLDRLREARELGLADDFSLNHDACEELFSEGTLFYFRYLHLFHLRDWDRVARDTARNLRLFDFVHRHAAEAQDRDHLEKWRPYLLRMNGIARTMTEWEAGRHELALRVARDTVEQIEGLDEFDDETFRFERQRSLQALREIVAQVEQTRPASERERLQRELREAIETQAFEEAAVLRDRLRALPPEPPV